MTGQHDHDRFDDHTDLERRLRSAMDAQADRFEPSEDSYLRLRREVHSQVDRRPALAPRILAVAAAFALVAVAGSWMLRTDDTTDLDLTPATATTAPPTTTATSVVIEADAEASTTTIASVYPTLAADVVTAQRRATPEEAVADFLGFVRLQGLDVDLQGAKAALSVDGAWVGTAMVSSVPLYDGSGDGFTVSELVNDELLTIDSFSAGTDVAGVGLEVAGAAPDGTRIEITLFSNHDGVALDRREVVADGGRYGSEVTLTGHDSGWVLVSAFDDEAGLVATVAKPLVWTAGDAAAVYTVALISPDDPDGGLNVRNVPGVDEGEVGAVFAPGAEVRRRGRVPADVDGTEWWAVEGTTRDGEAVTGWVAAHLLVAPAEIDPAVVDEFARLLTETAADTWSWHARAAIGRPTALTMIESPAASLGGQLGDLITPIDPDAAWSVEAPAVSGETADALAQWWFPKLTPLTFAAADSTERVTLYLEATAEGPTIVGVVGWDA